MPRSLETWEIDSPSCVVRVAIGARYLFNRSGDWSNGCIGSYVGKVHMFAHPVRQALRCDLEGTYVRRWLEGLRDVPTPLLFLLRGRFHETGRR
jgi:hypothetical protein